MKKYTIIILLLFLSSFSFSQDFLGGDIQLEVDGLGLKTRVRIFTDANMGIIRNSLTITPTGGYIMVSKVNDTLLTSNIRLSIYEGDAGGSSLGGILTYDDSLSIHRIANAYDSTSYTEYVKMFLWSDLSVGGFIYEPNPVGPICSDIMNAYYIENNILHYQIECPDTSPIFYSLFPLSEDLLVNNVIPNGFDLDSLTGKITWVNPPDSGLYMFRVYLVEADVWGNITTNARIMFFDFDDPVPFTSNTTELVNKNHLQVFPNPTTDQLTVKFDYFTPDNTQIQVFDITGRMVHQQTMTRQNHQIQMWDFPSGVYVVSVRSGDEVMTRKVVKN
jgi:hypothetical protein